MDTKIAILEAPNQQSRYAFLQQEGVEAWHLLEFQENSRGDWGLAGRSWKAPVINGEKSLQKAWNGLRNAGFARVPTSQEAAKAVMAAFQLPKLSQAVQPEEQVFVDTNEDPFADAVVVASSEATLGDLVVAAVTVGGDENF